MASLQSHHRPRDGPFELNDVFAMINAVPAIALISYGFSNQGLVPGLCLGIVSLSLQMTSFFWQFIPNSADLTILDVAKSYWPPPYFALLINYKLLAGPTEFSTSLWPVFLIVTPSFFFFFFNKNNFVYLLKFFGN